MKFDYKHRITTPIEDQPIDKLLNSLRMETAFFTQSILTRPWALKMPAIDNCMIFHMMTEGTGVFCIDNSEIQLNKGDFILFPKGEGHLLSDGLCKQFTPLAELPIATITERYETLSFGGNGEKTDLICGTLLFQHPLAIKVLGILPSHVIVRCDDNLGIAMMTYISQLLAAETFSVELGAEAILSRLADIIVIMALRQHLTGLSNEKIGWLSALQDDRIGAALSLIHETPAHHWSLDELAKTVAMSRTSFAQQFKKLVGNTPMEYLTEWRMSLAYSRLQLSKDTMLTIALDIGYQSEAAFSRAFKKIIGQSPNEIRKAYQTAH